MRPSLVQHCRIGADAGTNMTDGTFSEYLMAGEQLVWWDAPQQGFMLSARDGYLIPFSLLWCAFAAIWEWKALSAPAPLFFQLWGAPFILAGLFFVFGRFLLDA